MATINPLAIVTDAEKRAKSKQNAQQFLGNLRTLVLNTGKATEELRKLLADPHVKDTIVADINELGASQPFPITMKDAEASLAHLEALPTATGN